MLLLFSTLSDKCYHHKSISYFYFIFNFLFIYLFLAISLSKIELNVLLTFKLKHSVFIQ